MLEIRIHGYGGQGAVTLAHLLAQAALNNGRQGQALPSFGVERRGAPVKAVVRVSDEPIVVFSQSIEPNILVMMDKKLVEPGLSEGAKPDTTLLVNSADPIETDHPLWIIDAVSVALEAGLVSPEGPFINIPMLGAAARVTGVPLEVMERTLAGRWSGRTLEKNLQGIRTAYEKVTRV